MVEYILVHSGGKCATLYTAGGRKIDRICSKRQLSDFKRSAGRGVKVVEVGG